MGKRKHKETFTTDYLEFLADGDFTTYHYKVMLLLLTGTFTQAQLAKRLNIKKQNIGKVVKKLTEQGYIINTRTAGREKYFTANRKFKETNLTTKSESDSATEKVATNGNFSEGSPEVSCEDYIKIYDDNFSENDNSESDITTEKVATNSNFSEGIPEVSDEDYVEIYDDDFSENDNSESDITTEKVATNSNFSEGIPEVSDEDYVEIYDDDFSENDNSEPDSTTEKVATNGNFSESSPEVSCEDYIEIYDDDFSGNDNSEPDSTTEKVATYVNFSEDNFGEPDFIDKFQLENDFTEDNAEKPETQIIFRDDRHKKLYKDFCGRMECLDCYHRSLAYLLALDSVLREKSEFVFNFENDGVIFDALYNGFQTVISMKTTRLAFNLWNGCCYDIAEKSEVFYTPEQIFSFREYAPYYWQAIKIRFEIETND